MVSQYLGPLFLALKQSDTMMKRKKKKQNYFFLPQTLMWLKSIKMQTDMNFILSISDHTSLSLGYGCLFVNSLHVRAAKL